MLRFKSGSFSNVFRRVCCRCLSLHHKLCYKDVILGIETSCDDTGAAVVDSSGKILGEALNSQQQLHLELSNRLFIHSVRQDKIKTINYTVITH